MSDMNQEQCVEQVVEQTELLELTGLQERFGDAVQSIREGVDCPVAVVDRKAIVDVCHYLKGEQGYEMLIDLCGVDMSEYPGFVEGDPRFEVVYNLLSIQHNKRLRLKVLLTERELISSVVEVWPTVNWFEREAFEMYGIIFNHHPDLRRLLTDYGFEGHPMLKDFPVTGRVEMFFDEEQWRCVYRSNKVENRVLIERTWPGVDRG
ncbi:MAG: NADH-quinone oxidoreductase subunit C [Mariprofundaceae bacterium]|nr:NADH-quinone oxidoreductase subunit C [Mariprofundaceae bacterium]